MQLSEFIITNRLQILNEWVAFARTILPHARGMDITALRDHGLEMLNTIAAEMGDSQTDEEQSDKSMGRRDAPVFALAGDSDTAAQSHGASRAESGFDLVQMVSEYRALRASVLRLWKEEAARHTVADLDEVMRFNEAVDQSLAEATTRYSQHVTHSTEMFLAMLGHDLRTPLSAMINCAEVISSPRADPATTSKMGSTILNSGKRLTALIDDLADFTRSRLGVGLSVKPTLVDLNTIAAQTVNEVRAVYPQVAIQLLTSGDLHVACDSVRISQALSNLITNAVQYKAKDSAIDVTLGGNGHEVLLAVRNWGPVIPADKLTRILDPLYRIDVESAATAGRNMGLGLYIADRIAAAHGGRLDVESSSDGGTKFTIRLPRRNAQA